MNVVALADRGHEGDTVVSVSVQALPDILAPVARRPVPTMPEIPYILDGRTYLREDILNLIRFVFKPYRTRTKASMAKAFESVAKMDFGPRIRSKIPVHLFLEYFENHAIDTEVAFFCPLGYAAMLDGIASVSPVCAWDTAQHAWHGLLTQSPILEEWIGDQTTIFTNMWDDGVIDAAMLAEAFSS